MRMELQRIITVDLWSGVTDVRRSGLRTIQITNNHKK